MKNIVVLSLLILSFASCTSDITLTIDDKNPPSFTFKRNYSEVNNLLFFEVVELAAENQKVSSMKEDDSKNRTIWRIVAAARGEAGTIDKLAPITYGNCPAGFTQEVPKDGPAPRLMEGKAYEASGPHMMMRKAIVRFLIRDVKLSN